MSRANFPGSQHEGIDSDDRGGTGFEIPRYMYCSRQRLRLMRSPALLLTCVLMLAAESFPPAEVEILDIDYGQTSDPLVCSAKQKYCSIVFNGMSGDRVQVQGRGDGADKPFVAVADGSLKELAHGPGDVTATLPEVTDKLATYYIVFCDPSGKPGKFTIQLKKTQ